MRQCFQHLLYNLSNQRWLPPAGAILGPVGVAVTFPLCEVGGGSALIGCGGPPSSVTFSGNVSGPPCNSAPGTWLANLCLFLQDFRDTGLYRVAATTALWGAGAGYRRYGDGLNPPLPPDLIDGCTGRLASDPELRIGFWPAAPFAVGEDLAPGIQELFPWMPGHNDSYNCSPRNPVFVGWDKIYLVMGRLLDAIKDFGAFFSVSDVHLLGEIDLGNFTVQARVIHDNKHGDQYGSEAEPLRRMRDLIEARWPKSWGRVSYSIAGDRSANPATQCNSAYDGRSARVRNLSILSNAIEG